VAVSWIGPQNQVGYGFPIARQNRQEDEDSAGHASRFSILLRLKVSQGRVSKSSLKTGGGTMQMVHMESLQRSCGDEAEDEWSMRWAASDSYIPTLPFLLY
jgi:hypothetical protein